MKGDGKKIDDLENVINTLDTIKRNCKKGKNSIRYEDLRDAIYYLCRYQHFGEVLTRVFIDYSGEDEDENIG